MLDKTTSAAVARELARSWDTVNDVAAEETTALLLTAGAAHFAGVKVIESTGTSGPQAGR